MSFRIEESKVWINFTLPIPRGKRSDVLLSKVKKKCSGVYDYLVWARILLRHKWTLIFQTDVILLVSNKMPLLKHWPDVLSLLFWSIPSDGYPESFC